MRNIVMVILATLCLSACAPKVGSPEWCENMDNKDKGDWTVNEAKDYARHCIFR